MTVFIATTPSYGHPSGLPPAPPEGEGRKKEGTTQDASVKLYLGGHTVERHVPETRLVHRVGYATPRVVERRVGNVQ